MKRVAWKTSVAAALVMAGVGILLVQWGALDAGAAWRAWRAWPVLLIVLGLEWLWLARGRGLPVFVAPALVALAVVAAWFVPRGEAGAHARFHLGWPGRGGALGGSGETSSGRILEAGGPVELRVAVGAADLDIVPGTGDAVVVAWSGLEPVLEEAPGRITVKGDAHRMGFDCGAGRRGRDVHWEVRVPPDVPIRLAVDAGAADVKADLAQLKVVGVYVSGGASDLSLSLPAPAGELPVRVDAGASDVKVDVPAGVAVRVRADSALGSVDVAGIDARRDGDAWVTPGWDAAPARVDLRMNGGVSDVKVRRR